MALKNQFNLGNGGTQTGFLGLGWVLTLGGRWFLECLFFSCLVFVEFFFQVFSLVSPLSTAFPYSSLAAPGSFAPYWGFQWRELVLRCLWLFLREPSLQFP